MKAGQQVNLEPNQVAQAAAAGLTLLNTPGAVSVPGPMALTNNIQILNAVLTAIANGTLVLINAPAPEGGKLPPPAEEEKEEEEAMKVTKEQGLHITLAGIVAFLPLLPIMWFIGKPVISTALAEDIKSAAQEQIGRAHV